MPQDFTAAARWLEKLLSQFSLMKTAYTAGFDIWRGEVQLALKRFYGEKSEEHARFTAIEFAPPLSREADWTEVETTFQRGAQEARFFLQARIDDLTASPAMSVSNSTASQTLPDPSNK